MAFNVTLRQSGRQFQVEPDEAVLIAALRQGIGLPYGCKNGACGSCKGTVVSGEVEQAPHSSSALSNDEKTRGMALFCCATAQTDLEIDVREVAGVGDVQVKKLPCRVNALARRADDVVELKLQLPANERLQYLAGQYIEFILKDGKRRSYSMASPPHHEGPLELHIRHMPGGTFTDHGRPMTLYWGGRRKKDLYMMDLAEQWAKEVPNFSFVPVLSEPDADDAWTGRTGFVHRAVIEDLPDLSAYQVYACGAPVMVESAQRDFTNHHRLPEDEFYADSFTSAADLAHPV
jgi:CDP-4-dehydro-6-deoxyglucose reductase